MTSVRFAYESKSDKEKTSVLDNNVSQIINENLKFYKVNYSLNAMNELIISKNLIRTDSVPFLDAVLTKYHENDKDRSIVPDWKAAIELASPPVSK